MSVLCVDAGNTRIKWGYSANGRWTETGAVLTTEVESLEAAWSHRADCDRVLVSNVAGQKVAEVIGRSTSASASVEFVRPRPEAHGLRSAYDTSQLGSDRWCALLGAFVHGGAPCIVVNAGTTLTVDALSRDAIFLGGFIVPGYELLREALATNTAGLARRPGAFHFFPDNTGDAIASGAINALSGAIERMTRFLTESDGLTPAVILSGGDSALLAPQLGQVEVVDNLVLEGLRVIGTNSG